MSEKLYSLTSLSSVKDKTFSIGGEKITAEFQEQRDGTFLAKNLPYAVIKKYKGVDGWKTSEMKNGADDLPRKARVKATFK